MSDFFSIWSFHLDSLTLIKVICRPFIEDHEVHIAESQRHEDDLWDKLKEEIEVILKVECIDSLKNNTTHHMNNSDDDSQFHLIRVQKLNIVGCL